MSRAVANTLLPAKRPASTSARPRPRELPVTNHLRHSILLFAESELLRDRTCCRKYCTARNYDSASCRTMGPEVIGLSVRFVTTKTDVSRFSRIVIHGKAMQRTRKYGGEELPFCSHSAVMVWPSAVVAFASWEDQTTCASGGQRVNEAAFE